MGALHVSSQNFEQEVLKSNIPVLVDFWAEWCGPCRMLGPIIDELAGDLNGRLKVVKVNIDESQDLAARYNVMSIPTLILIKGGAAVAQTVGAMPKEQILEKIKAHLS